ncbi:MAG TPA: thiamine pyrophosphate-binding protein [bacterium]|nr:thiamine pyrophosphate-binding protein [bacterium]
MNRPRPRTAADAFVAVLRDAGVRHLFGLPGSTEASLLDALARDGEIRYVMALHESAAVAMADGYARATGRPAVVSLHTSVGVMNGMGHTYNAWRDQSPVVVTAGHKDRDVLAQDGFCALPDLPGLLASFTKWTWQSLSASAVASDLRRALHVASVPPRGPVFLAVPEDMLGEPVAAGTPAPLNPEVAGSSDASLARRPDAGAVRSAAGLLLQARAPVLLLGNDAAAARQDATALAEALVLPVLVSDPTELSVLPFPTGHPQYLGVYGGEPAVLDGCDVLAVIGGRVFFPFSGPRTPELPPGAKLIHVHPDPRQVGWSVRPSVGMAADAGPALRDLAAAAAALGGVDPAARTAREARIASLRHAMRTRLTRERDARWDAVPISVLRVMSEIGRVLPAGAVVVDEAVRSTNVALSHLSLPSDAAWYHTGGGALGWGVPVSIGMRLAQPERTVVALVGDGAFHFSAQALWTAAREEVRVVTVVLDNGGYLAVKRAIEGFVGASAPLGTYPGTTISHLDHCEVARGYGARATLVTRPDDLASAVEAAIASTGPAVVVVRVEEVR